VEVTVGSNTLPDLKSQITSLITKRRLKAVLRFPHTYTPIISGSKLTYLSFVGDFLRSRTLLRYLNNLENNTADKQSCSYSINLNTPVNNLANGWATEQVPLAKSQGFDQPASGKPVLTTSKLGDWHGEMLKIDYPIQVIDCFRDIYMNVTWHMGARLTEHDQGSNVCNLLSWIRDDTELFGGGMRKIGINSNAWASRVARNAAIENSQSSIYISQQMLVDYLQKDVKEFRVLRDQINAATGLTAQKLDWDGWIWPYGKSFLSFILSTPRCDCSTNVVFDIG
jgi:hypothetical protein